MKLTRAQLKLVFECLSNEIESAVNDGRKPPRGSQALYDKIGKELGYFQ